MSIRRVCLAGYLLLLLISHGIRATRPEPAPPPGAIPLAPMAGAAGATLTDTEVQVAFRDLRPPAAPGAPVLVFLHGSPGGQHDLDSLVPHLRDRFRIVAMDLPGFGASTRDVPDYSVRAHARYVLQLLDSLGISEAHFVAYSMGGGVALNVYDLAPQRVASVTMLAAIGVQELELFGDYRLNHFVHGAQLGALWLLREATPHFGALDRTLLGVEYARNFYDTDQRPLRPILESLAAPMLILHGTDDFLVLPEAAREHHRIVPHAEMVLFDTGHFVVFNGGHLLAPPLADFVSRVEAGQAMGREAATPERVAAARAPYDPRSAPPFTAIALVLILSLIAVATLVSEDLTCIATGLLVAQGRLGFVPGVVACAAGIFVGDVMLYVAGRFLGRPALERRPLSWLLRRDRLDAAAAWFEERGPVVIFLSRFVPGLRLPTYFAAGVLRTGFWKFVFFFLLAVAAWTPLLVASSVFLGERAFEYFEVFSRQALPALLVLALSILMIVKVGVPLLSHRGRRRLLGAWRRWTRWEFWPPWLFYPPVVAWIAWLGLRHRGIWTFTAANPAIEAGGLIAESKWKILQGLAGSPEAVARTVFVPGTLSTHDRLQRIRDFQQELPEPWPIVLKPDLGQRGSGVALARDEGQLRGYLERAPYDLLAQAYAPGHELGVFYYRYPGRRSGAILSVTDKRMPVVTGDGVRTLERLILDDPRAVALHDAYLRVQRAPLDSVPASGERVQLVELGTHCRGAVFLDGAKLVTPALTAAIDEISRRFDGFYFGRYDLRVNDLQALAHGEGFKIIELNGVTSEATHIYDPRYRVWEAWAVLFRQWRIAFEIGAANRATGVRPVGWREVARLVSSYRATARHHSVGAVPAVEPVRRR